jgi:hypothetical protein
MRSYLSLANYYIIELGYTASTTSSTGIGVTVTAGLGSFGFAKWSPLILVFFSPLAIANFSMTLSGAFSSGWLLAG